MKKTNKIKEKPLLHSFTWERMVFSGAFILLAISVIAEMLNPAYKTNPLLYGLITGLGGLFFKSLMTKDEDR